MNYLKSIVAVYLGSFFALPVCPCQVLPAFGIDAFGHGTVSEVVEVSIGNTASDFSLHCYCEDDCDKVAELNRARNEIPNSFVVIEVVSSIGRTATKSVDRFPTRRSRAPPDLETWSLSSYSGVFLL